MAKSPVKFGLGEYEEGKPFALKSGNKPLFKKMGAKKGPLSKKGPLKAELPKFSDFLKEASMRDLKTAFEM